MPKINIKQHKLLLADNDADDCLFFRQALAELVIPNILQTLNDGALYWNFTITP